MSYLDDVKWENGKGFNDLIAFGIGPARKFTDMVFEETASNIDIYPEELSILCFAVLDYLDDMEKCIYRFMDEVEQDQPSPPRLSLYTGGKDGTEIGI